MEGTSGSRETGILYGEDESGPCTGDERTGQGAPSCPFVQRGQQRIMGRERRVRSRPLGPQHQAKTSKSGPLRLFLSVCLCLLAFGFVRISMSSGAKASC